MKTYIGTSGWSYDWNKGKSLEWYVQNSGLDAIEINATFYRFPTSASAMSWAQKGGQLRWSVKVNHSVTHHSKFGQRSEDLFRRFKEPLAPLDKNIDFYLFQLPPDFFPKDANRISEFAGKVSLGKRFAFEPRNKEWFSPEWTEWAKDNCMTFVSVDAPDLPRNIYAANDTVYLRMHGRVSWYRYNYSEAELEEIAEKIMEVKPRRAYIFFNNDHNMLRNARMMRGLF
ncbi:Uncharacterised protein [uncultured archaeon]|nr:Uncharacterised protein [uncultured archaeon]